MSAARIFLGVLLILQSFTCMAQEVDGVKSVTDSVALSGYGLIMSKGAAALNKGEFDVAHQYYKQAIALKPGDTYAFKMLKVAEASKWAYAQKQAKDIDLRRKAEINILMSDALKAIMAKKYDSARALYSRILVLNPVKSQKEFVEQKIKTLDQALGRPASNTINTAPTVAQATQKPIQGTIKKDAPPVSTPVAKNNNTPSTANPVKVEKTTTSTTQTNQNSKPKEQIDSPAAQASLAKQPVPDRVTPAKEVIDNVQKTVKDNKVDASPATSAKQVPSGISKPENEAAKKKIDSIEDQTKKVQSKEVENRPIPAPAEKKASITESPKPQPALQQGAKSSSSSTARSIVAAANNKSAVDTKNNVVRTETTPADQTSNTSIAINTPRIAEISGKILNEKGRLNLSDSIGSVKLTCQEIVVNDKNTFIKFLIQNTSSTEAFNPGALQLLYIKNYGILQKLNGRLVTNPTSILPRQDMPVVYVADAAPEAELNEVFVFEMEEKSKKLRLTINIPAQVYLNEKKINSL